MTYNTIKESKILIVDDMEINLRLIEEYLRSANCGYTVIKARNGKEAYLTAQKELPDLLIMDWEMPEMTGIEAIQELLAKPETREIPVIMLTSMLSSEKLKEALDAGAVDYLRKPVDRIELLSRVKNTLKTTHYYQEILAKNKIIEEKNKQFTDSIRYAGIILDSLRTPESEFHNQFPNSFLIFLPKDIVSGDFYWFAQIPKTKKFIVIAADCTGHGVPGALLATIGNIILKDVVFDTKIYEPDEILLELHKNLRKILWQDKTNSQLFDGMEVAVCVIDQASNILQYAGAVSDLVYFQNGKLKQISGSIFEIGGMQSNKPVKFEKHSISIDVETTVYLFSDGIYDQIGGHEGKRFTKEKLFNFLVQAQQLPFDEQKKLLHDVFQKWMGTNHQTDDVLLMGFQIKP